MTMEETAKDHFSTAGFHTRGSINDTSTIQKWNIDTISPRGTEEEGEREDAGQWPGELILSLLLGSIQGTILGLALAGRISFVSIRALHFDNGLIM